MEKRYPETRPIVVDFFCGAGGMSLGFEQSGFDIALGVDIDGYHVATHERNFPYGKSLRASIVDLDGDRIRELIGTDREIDVVVGGPPCQGFSHMGLRDLKDPRNSLIDHYVRLVFDLRPKAFVMENVPGMLSGATRSILESVIRIAGENAYNVTLPVSILNAADFGVPQHRRRLFVLGIRRDVGAQLPYPSGPCKGQPPRPTVEGALSDLPVVERSERLFRINEAPYTSRPGSRYARVMRGIEQDPSDLSRPRLWDSELCTGCLRTRHSAKTVGLYSATPPGETVPGHKLPRLDPNGICPTLRAGADSAHGSYTAPRPIHPKYPRCITSREAARLHGFPDWFAFYPLKWHAYRQIGNAVCPPVARAIGTVIRQVLGGTTTNSAPSAVRLESTFILASDRPRTLKRIPQIRQFPPVIEHLFRGAYDDARNRLRKATFTFADVREAIAATGANLHWIREETFLGEIARSRRVADMLAPALEFGYSIMPCSEGGAMGRFVPTGTPGTLDQKGTLGVRIGEIHGAERLKLQSVDLNGDGWGAISILSQDIVQRRIWSRSDLVVGLSDGKGPPKHEAGVFRVSIRRPPRFIPEQMAVISCKSTSLPTRSRIARVASSREIDKVIVLIAATRKHVVAIRFDNCASNPREAVRAAFEMQ